MIKESSHQRRNEMAMWRKHQHGSSSSISQQLSMA